MITRRRRSSSVLRAERAWYDGTGQIPWNGDRRRKVLLAGAKLLFVLRSRERQREHRRIALRVDPVQRVHLQLSSYLARISDDVLAKQVLASAGDEGE